MNNTNEDAYAFAETFVDARLKAPSTAEHATPSHARITANKDRTLFEVSSYVDSENSFGAKIRSQYTVKMRYDVASDKWFLLDLKLE